MIDADNLRRATAAVSPREAVKELRETALAEAEGHLARATCQELAEEFERRSEEEGLLGPIRGTWMHAATRCRQKQPEQTSARDRHEDGEGVSPDDPSDGAGISARPSPQTGGAPVSRCATGGTAPDAGIQEGAERSRIGRPSQDCDDLCSRCDHFRYAHMVKETEEGPCAEPGCSCDGFTEQPQSREKQLEEALDEVCELIRDEFPDVVEPQLDAMSDRERAWHALWHQTLVPARQPGWLEHIEVGPGGIELAGDEGNAGATASPPPKDPGKPTR